MCWGQLKPEENIDLSKKHKLNKFEMFSMKGIKNNDHVITKPSLKSVYMPGINKKKKQEPEFVLMRCISCIFYVMVREGNPKCPNCHRSDVLLAALPRDILMPQENKDSSKKRKLDKFEMLSLNRHVISEQSLKSVYVAGNNKKKATDKQGDSQHELNHVLAAESKLEHEPECILMRCINCIFYVMVHRVTLSVVTITRVMFCLMRSLGIY
ncbi:hypothetical protein Hanom_Chr10g00926301 [Helianthus anomalus]